MIATEHRLKETYGSIKAAMDDVQLIHFSILLVIVSKWHQADRLAEYSIAFFFVKIC